MPLENLNTLSIVTLTWSNFSSLSHLKNYKEMRRRGEPETDQVLIKPSINNLSFQMKIKISELM